jgi:hypothetical protein
MLLPSAPLPATEDHAASYVLAAILILGGAFNLLAAFVGIRRQGDLRSTIGRQLQAVIGKSGAIAVWLVCGVVCVTLGIWFLVRAG